MLFEDTLNNFILPDDVKIETPPLSPPGDISMTTVAMDTDILLSNGSIVQLPPTTMGQTLVSQMPGNMAQVLNSKIKIKPKPLQPLHPKTVTVSQVAPTVSPPAGKIVYSNF